MFPTRALPLLLVGCGIGHLDDGGGRQPLRTALYATWTEGESEVAGVFLSNGDIACDLAQTLDASEAEQLQIELFAAACREDARHVLLEYERPLTSPWGGEYVGSELFDGSPRVTGRYYAVVEAVLAREDGLAREFRVTEDEDVPLGDGGSGWLDEPADERLSGGYTMPGTVETRFDARACEADDRIFRVLASVGRIPCETE